MAFEPFCLCLRALRRILQFQVALGHWSHVQYPVQSTVGPLWPQTGRMTFFLFVAKRPHVFVCFSTPSGPVSPT